MEATGNDDLITEWRVMETCLQVRSYFAVLGIPQAINVITSTAKTASNKAVAENKRETEKGDNKAGKDTNHKTTKKVKLHPIISVKIIPLLVVRNLSMRNLVRSIGIHKPSDLLLDKKMCVTAELKGECGFKGCTFTHEDNMVTDVMSEMAVNLLDKFIKNPTIITMT